MKKILSLLLALALCAGLGVPALAADQFTDVPAGHAFRDAAVWAAEQGVAGGYGDGTFRPGNPVTRAQFCVMLARAFYPADVQRLTTRVYTDQGWFVPSTRALFENGVLENVSFIRAFATEDTMVRNISRYDMAQLMTNVMAAGGFAADEGRKAAAQVKIGDYGSVPAQYRDAVKNVFALGLITGYPDGSFGGENPMNRGQGCVVIYRMSQYVPLGSGSPAVEASAAQPETPKRPETPAQSESGTLANGKPITEENVKEVINTVLRVKYPEGTVYQPVGTSIKAGLRPDPETGKTAYISGRECYGWGMLASDIIFGETPTNSFRERTDITTAKAGDILFYYTDGKYGHTALITESRIYKCKETGENALQVQTVDSGSTHKVGWEETTAEERAQYGDDFWLECNGTCTGCMLTPERGSDFKESWRIFTRYPE